MSMTAQTPHAEAVEAARHAWSTEFIPREVVKAAIRAYLAAMAAKGWKLCPRVMTMDMRLAQVDKPGPGDVCWEAGKAIQRDNPNGLDTLPPFSWWSEHAWGAWALAHDAAPPPEGG